MSKTLVHKKRALKLSLIVVALCALAMSQLFEPAQAQHATPSVNGAIGTNEYGTHTDGQNSQSTSTAQTWYMTWDETNLYVAVTNANLAESAIIYIDRNPISPVNGGSDADGNLGGL